MKKNMQGFTLIELMIVVAIIAILAAIALPAYQDYLVKTRVSEIITAASGARTAVAEAAAADPSPTTMPATAPIENQHSKFVSGTTYASGVITATATGLVGGTVVAGDTILLTGTKQSNGQVDWVCSSTTIDAKYRPSTCQ